MRSRRKAREAVLQALYQCDALNNWSIECVTGYFSHFQKEALETNEDLIKDNLRYAQTLAQGVVSCLNFIDSQISSASSRWSISRMLQVDRNILRLATFEILFVNEVPTNVSINEAIEIGKRFGSVDTPTFINGVLDKIASMNNKHSQAVENA